MSMLVIFVPHFQVSRLKGQVTRYKNQVKELEEREDELMKEKRQQGKEVCMCVCVESRRVCMCVHNCSVCTVHVRAFVYMCMLCLCVSVCGRDRANVLLLGYRSFVYMCMLCLCVSGCGRDRANVLLLGYRSPLALPRFAACNLSVKTIKQKLTFLNAE